MQVSARVHYGCLAMLELAQRYTQDRPVALREIVARQEIPQPFLVQILQSLRASNLVISTRGSGGGYRLAVPPQRISVLEIAEAIGCGDSSSGGAEGTADQAEATALRDLWIRADEAAREALASTSLADLVTACNTDAESMFYI
ncbi:RrF2 family transcriptional regulator [Planctomycetaceae bacterium SH139]